MSKPKFTVGEIYDTKLMAQLTFHVGKNAQSNWHLIDAASPDDLWFHARGQPSAHVVLKMPQGATARTLNQMTLVNCGRFCGGKIVIYTEIRNVKKMGATGSVHAGKTREVVLE